MRTPAVNSQADWRTAAAGLSLVALLGWPIVVVATMAKPFATEELVAAEVTVGQRAPMAYPQPIESDDIGSFAFGYVEFDIDPRRPGGVPGFDSWPPGSPRR